MKLMLSIAACLFIFLLTAPGVDAKMLPQASGGAKKTTNITKATGSGITVSPRLRADRLALIINFASLQNATSISYTLSYSHDGQNEGAGGTISGAGNSASRDLLFGTCSHGVCTYHRNIKNAKLEVTYTIPSGKKYLKRYKIKV